MGSEKCREWIYATTWIIDLKISILSQRSLLKRGHGVCLHFDEVLEDKPNQSVVIASRSVVTCSPVWKGGIDCKGASENFLG